MQISALEIEIYAFKRRYLYLNTDISIWNADISILIADFFLKFWNNNICI